MIVFKNSSMAQILIVVLFLKIMLIMDFDDFSYSSTFLLASLRLSPELSLGTVVTATEQGRGSVDPSDVRRLFSCRLSGHR
jgi:hypothetical protein